jgi:hypothetical protein
VNGDGYSDVIIGANGYNDGANTDEGWAYVYHGSPAGINTSATWSGESNQALGNYGIWVNSAGDINADGYGDVIVGAYHMIMENPMKVLHLFIMVLLRSDSFGFCIIGM